MDREAVRIGVETMTAMIIVKNERDIKNRPPVDLKPVFSESFLNAAATTLMIPSGFTAIEAGKFKNSKIRNVTVPVSVAWLADNAINGCSRIIFITSCSIAVQYAAKHGFYVARL